MPLLEIWLARITPPEVLIDMALGLTEMVLAPDIDHVLSIKDMIAVTLGG